MKVDHNNNTYPRILRSWNRFRNSLFGDYKPIVSLLLGLPPADYAATRELLENEVDRRCNRLTGPFIDPLK